MLISVGATLLCVGIAFTADPIIKVPAELKVQAGRQLPVKAETTAKTIKWVILTDGTVDLTLFPDGKEAIFSSPFAGTYKILLYTAVGDVPSEPVYVIITVEGGPTPPVPPMPPIPPPVPPTPGPDDVLLNTLNKAFAKETTTDKVSKIQNLVTLYKRGATNTVMDPQVITVTNLIDVMHTATNTLIGNDLPLIRGAIQTELNTKLPLTGSTVLTDDNRKDIAVQFQRIADILSKVK